ncbi:MAG: peptide chain release factor 2 [Candidatus Dadabacteria bacterium]|nr:MAG: peptide chain release factor 2 [Candidatus Dadabacteria bacterium]
MRRSLTPCGGFFDIPAKRSRLEDLESKVQDSSFWEDQDRAKQILKEKSRLEASLSSFDSLCSLAEEARTAIELWKDENDPELMEEASAAVRKLAKEVAALEFSSKMSGEYDEANAILEINGGAGGTEAQDWAEMLYRMYLRWAERRGFKAKELDRLPGEAAGVKSVTVLVEGQYAYGYLKAEQGVHRLVRISPFDSNARRHTSFASVAVTPDIEDDVEVDIDEGDLKIDTFRASGAGGQHVNKTDSAVRITHIPTGIVVVCQNERSQHKNKALAMKILKGKLIERELRLKEEKLNEIKGERKKIDFGSQIRSYVMHPYRMVKDLRSGYETSDVDSVLDGAIDPFIESLLLMGKG